MLDQYINNKFCKNIAKTCCNFTILLFTSFFAFNLFLAPAWSVDYNKANLANEDFSGKDLTDSSFDHSNLRNANFSNTNLKGVQLFSSNLDKANFENANLRGADLESSRLTGVNLRNAILEDSFLMNAKFDGANIEGADFTNAMLRRDAEKSLCAIASGTNPVTGRNTKDTLYCP
jgi:uncharacterized protein YjbI with pentapeptide repeats